MNLRPQIPAVEGVQDKQVAGILGAVKTIIDAMTGRAPNRPQIKTLGPNASQGALVSKVNELINRMQGAAETSAVTTTLEGKSLSASGYQIFFGGLTVQWASSVIQLDGSANGAITFPVAFSKACFLVVCCSGDANATGGNPVEIIDGATTASSFSVHIPTKASALERINFVAFGN